MQEEIGAHLAPKTGNGGGVYGDAVAKGAIQLCRQNGDVFLFPEDITEGQADEAHILLFHILAYFLFGKVHDKNPFPDSFNMTKDNIAQNTLSMQIGEKF
jgi:hypothetical protein